MRFVAIAGFVILGLYSLFLFISSFGMSRAMSQAGLGAFSMMGPSLIVVVVIIMWAVGFFPLFFLLRFGMYIKKYMYTNDSQYLEEAFKNNKSYWVFNGIMMIIALGFFAIFFLIAIVGGIGLAMMMT